MTILSDERKYQIDFDDIERRKYRDFELTMNLKSEAILNILDNGFKLPHHKISGKGLASNDEDLKILIEKNKQLSQEIESKLADVSQQQTKYQSYKQDQKLLSKEIKETHEAFLMAKKYYKKYLKIYYTIESRKDDKETIYVQFFTESKKDSDKFSARFLRDSKNGHYELLDLNPRLETLQDLQKNLQETNDVPSVLYKIREGFLSLKNQN